MDDPAKRPHLHPRDSSICPVPLHQWRACMRRVSPLCGLIAPGLAVEFTIHVHQRHLPGCVPFHLILSSMPVVWIKSSADRADNIPQWLAETRQHTGPCHPTVPSMYKGFDGDSLVSPTAVQLPPVPFYNLSNLRPGAVVICSFLRHSLS